MFVTSIYYKKNKERKMDSRNHIQVIFMNCTVKEVNNSYSNLQYRLNLYNIFITHVYVNNDTSLFTPFSK